MKISLMLAMDSNNAIGYKNELMWHLPDDFKWFKKHTLGKPMIMGRNTMTSLGKPLPDRMNIVLSSRNEDIIPGFIYADSLNNAYKLIPDDKDEIMIIGGGEVFRKSIGNADCIYLTRIDHAFENADTFFPEINMEEWETTYEEFHDIDDKHKYPFTFYILNRKN